MMDVDSDNELLTKVAADGILEPGTWPELLADILARLDKIAREEFSIPTLPHPKPAALPPTDSQGRLASPMPSSPLASQGTDVATKGSPEPPAEQQVLQPGELPTQLDDMLKHITTHLQSFTTSPPHTIQRLAELVLRPRAHYRALSSYLHAVDRVVGVTSGANQYPLPLPDMAGTSGAESVTWGNPTTAAASLGSDEALGGALLTPIPWVKSNQTQQQQPTETEALGGTGATIHSESTETIDGPNGMGSIETVSVSVNGVHSTGHARAITQGELLRQEQRAGVIPMSQLHRGARRAQQAAASEQDDAGGGGGGEEDNGEEQPTSEDAKKDADENAAPTEDGDEETPHARGPEEIGVNDTGPQGVSTSYIGEDGLQTQGIDVESAVGRRHAEDDAPEQPAAEGAASPTTSEVSGTKREAEDEPLEPKSPKKMKDGDDHEKGEEKEGEAKDADAMDTGK
ncbi:uncharacterized protein F5Z01DRAFT_650528 [Emericellopsis atlantica]|uniref:Protein phosphatase 4 core regulatory subunit R2 n=1 Tax=Emericellopsis atlantica TaxID=2614577 RepID=A0A9P8CQH0_9HYPO|nr:uncharacterized protein F5Z01DRAFT_650528 [Emericellopsis atlantica]KAG9255914.1 hypothetical protein F5Z01DRAFT_650528 [Emericellopsis atlantica]